MGIGGKGVTTVPPTTTVGGPSVVRTFPAITHRFAARPYLPSGITFARDSTVNGWTLDANGDPVLTEFAIDQPAFVIDPATGQSLGYRALAGFTNSLLWSRDLSDAGWGKNNVTIAQNAEGADGVADAAWTITENGSSSARMQRPETIPDDSNTHTVFALFGKNQSEDAALVVRLLGGTTAVLEQSNVDTVAGTASAGSIHDLGGWWGVSLSVTNNSTGNTTLRYEAWPDSTASGQSIVIDYPGVYLNSSIAGPPIETEDSPVSTAADDATEPLPASCQDGFVWVVHAVVPQGIGNGTYWIGEIEDDSGSSDIDLYFGSSSKITINVTIDGSFELAATAGMELTPGERVKVAFAAEAGDYRVSVNGSTVTKESLADFPNNLETKYIGKRSSGNYLNSTIAHDELHPDPENWTDADLQAATS